jgi:hypothetical protein
MWGGRGCVVGRLLGTRSKGRGKSREKEDSEECFDFHSDIYSVFGIGE